MKWTEHAARVTLVRMQIPSRREMRSFVWWADLSAKVVTVTSGWRVPPCVVSPPDRLVAIALAPGVFRLAAVTFRALWSKVATQRGGIDIGRIIAAHEGMAKA